MKNSRNRQVILRSRPTDIPQADNFEIIESDLPDLRGGEMLVRNSYLSVEPAMPPRSTPRLRLTTAVGSTRCFTRNSSAPPVGMPFSIAGGHDSPAAMRRNGWSAIHGTAYPTPTVREHEAIGPFFPTRDLERRFRIAALRPRRLRGVFANGLRLLLLTAVAPAKIQRYDRCIMPIALIGVPS